jgi:hypothetical protein
MFHPPRRISDPQQRIPDMNFSSRLTCVFALVCAIGLIGGIAPSFASAQGFTSDKTGLEEAANRAQFATDLPCRSQPGGCLPYFAGNVITAGLGLFGSVFFALILWGGLKWMTAQGDEKRVKDAQDTIKNAVIGLVVTIAAYSIATFTLDAIGTVTSSEGTGTAVNAEPVE